MKRNKASINIISSFNHANFVSLLKNSNNFDWEVNEVNYNQVFQTLTNSNAKIWKQKSNITPLQDVHTCLFTCLAILEAKK